MGLNVPAKVGNTDCTFCLECVSACPHDNIGLLPRMPGEELILNARPAAPRSLARRPDLAALLVVFAFGAFANAAGMVAPVLAWQDGMVARLGIERWMVVLASLALSIVVTPTLLVLIAGVLGAAWTGLTARRVELTCRMTASLVPIGFAMWFSHMVFHFVTSAGSIVPVTQRVLGDLGATWAGSPAWQMACCTTFPAWLLPLELTMLGAGLVVGVTVAWRLALEAGGSVSAGIRIAPPWFVINGLLYAVGAWILFQPMEMRGLLDG